MRLRVSTPNRLLIHSKSLEKDVRVHEKAIKNWDIIIKNQELLSTTSAQNAQLLKHQLKSHLIL